MSVTTRTILVAGLCIALLTAAQVPATPQDISFFHLSKKEGLSDNNVTAAVMDQHGLLWVGTMEGLNCYDGYSVKQFYHESYPVLQNNNILRLTCDEKNRLWIHFADKRVAMLDENRQFHAVQITDSGRQVTVDYLLPYTSRGVLFLCGSRLYAPDKNDPLHLVRVPWEGDTMLNHVFSRINIWDKDKLVCSGQNRLCLFDVTHLQVLYMLTIPDVLAAVRLNDQEALITTSNNDKLCRVNFPEGKVVKAYGQLKDQYGDPMHAFPRSIYHLTGNRFIFTSAYAGVYVFDASKETLTRYKHDPVDPQSISANNTSYIFSDTSGYFFVTSNSSGLNYFNIHHYLAKRQPFFRDDRTGHIFDGYVNCITADRYGHIWLGTQNRLIEWDRDHDKMYFRQYGTLNAQTFNGHEEVRALCFDRNNHLWVGLNRFGVVVMNEKNQPVKYLNADKKDQPLVGNLIYDIKESSGGQIWIATSNGLNIVDNSDFKVLGPDSDPIVKALHNVPCNVIWFRNETEAWVGTASGPYKINTVARTIAHYKGESELGSDNVFCITDDQEGNIYVGTDAGMYVVKNGQITASYDRSNELRSNICDGFLKDDSGKIWMGNDNTLLCYDPLSRRFEAYDEGTGLSGAGFRPFACFKNSDGELFWGAENGVSYFDPDRLRRQHLPLKLYIHTVTTDDNVYRVGQSHRLTFPFSQNPIGFGASAIDLLRSKNIVFRYRLEGADSAWKTTKTLDEIWYSHLSPGRYTFRAMASRDGLHWTEAQNDLTFLILTPWWRSYGFYVLCLLALTGMAFVVYRRKGIKNDEREIQKAVDYFAGSTYQYDSVESILWDIARNCISRLKLEDCVIYLLDAEHQVLQQKAAYGPKSPKEYEIYNPIAIPLGKGIVGSVAQKRKAELINDTRKDERYIIDDESRLSELAVPIIHDDTVIGVIDSEHRKRNFFTQKHLDALQSIASLCSAKISRAMAIEAMKKSEHALLELHRKMTESKFMNLRLQMNPHFLFNTLNSIQHLIVSGQSLQAYKYLNIFSNLMRATLQNAEEILIPLEEELRMLHLYLDLESLRFKDSFTYHILIDDELECEEVQIPPMMIQPFAENAIWHGLMHRDGEKKLLIEFTGYDDFLKCTIEDNGIGRAQVSAIQRRQLDSASHISKGIQIVRERLALLEQKTGKRSSLEIEDLYTGQGQPRGTRVLIHIPFYNPAEV